MGEDEEDSGPSEIEVHDSPESSNDSPKEEESSFGR